MSDDLQVLATDPPSNTLLIRVAGGESVALDAGPATRSGRVDLVVWRRSGPRVLTGATVNTPPWSQVIEADLVLASVVRVAHSTCVPQSVITDRRSFRTRVDA